MRKQNKDEVMKGYIDASERTALRMKELSDGLFNYFLLFGDEAPTAPLDNYNAETLIHQMVFEHVLLFRESGYSVEYSVGDNAQKAFGKFDISTDAQSLARIIGNLMSNWSKYADKSHPVSIYLDYSDEKYKLKFTNNTSSVPSAESNGIGVRTCRKLAEHILADFVISKDGALYSTTLIFYTAPKQIEEVGK
jgi:light-regulated signal transduction histidine kinase (bacteriophytochrome)